MNSPELVLRTAGLTCTLMLWLLVITRAGWRRHRALQVVLACMAGYLLCSASQRLCFTTAWGLIPLAGALAFPFALWRLSRVVLDDAVGIPVAAWCGLVLLLGAGVVAVAEGLPVPADLRVVAANLLKLIGVAFLGTAVWRGWRSWDGDMVEPRRRLRVWLVVGGSAYGMAVMAAEVYLRGQAPPVWLELLHLTLLVVLLAGALLYLAGLRPQAVHTLFEAVAPAGLVAMPEVSQVPGRADAQEAEMAHRLALRMREEHWYRDAELNVRHLAGQAGVPEYLLRRLIHDQLAHRNFAAFVNEFRLEEVATRLADPTEDRRPILTLALEAGFGSIGPFNRCFRERFGITPSLYREQRGLAPSSLSVG